MFEIKFTDSAIKDLRWFHNSELKVILASIELQLASDPVTETRNRRSLNGDDSGPWALRIGHIRVFYQVDKANRHIGIEAIGCRRSGRLADTPQNARAIGKKDLVARKPAEVRRGNIIVKSDEEDRLMSAGASDDWDLEVELTKDNRELMTFLDRRCKQKASVSLDRARKRLDIEN